jgi:hypothetical protein
MNVVSFIESSLAKAGTRLWNQYVEFRNNQYAVTISPTGEKCPLPGVERPIGLFIRGSGAVDPYVRLVSSDGVDLFMQVKKGMIGKKAIIRCNKKGSITEESKLEDLDLPQEFLDFIHFLESMDLKTGKETSENQIIAPLDFLESSLTKVGSKKWKGTVSFDGEDYFVETDIQTVVVIAGERVTGNEPDFVGVMDANGNGFTVARKKGVFGVKAIIYRTANRVMETSGSVSKFEDLGLSTKFHKALEHLYKIDFAPGETSTPPVLDASNVDGLKFVEEKMTRREDSFYKNGNLYSFDLGDGKFEVEVSDADINSPYISALDSSNKGFVVSIHKGILGKKALFNTIDNGVRSSNAFKSFDEMKLDIKFYRLYFHLVSDDFTFTTLGEMEHQNGIMTDEKGPYAITVQLNLLPELIVTDDHQRVMFKGNYSVDRVNSIIEDIRSKGKNVTMKEVNGGLMFEQTSKEAAGYVYSFELDECAPVADKLTSFQAYKLADRLGVVFVEEPKGDVITIAEFGRSVGHPIQEYINSILLRGDKDGE